MKLKPITSKKEYAAFLEWADQLIDKKAPQKTSVGQTLQIVLLLIRQYEDKHYPIPVPDPIEAIKLKNARKRIKEQRPCRKDR